MLPQYKSRRLDTGTPSARGRALIGLVSLLFGLACTLGVYAYADNPGDLRQAIDKQKSALNKTRAAQDQTQNQLRITQAQLDKTEKAQNDIEDRIEKIKSLQSDLEQQTTQLAAKIVHLKAQISDSLSMAYLLGNQAPISTLLSHDDALSSERYLYYIKVLVAQSINQLKALKQTEQAQQDNKTALEKAQSELNEAETQLATALAEHRTQLAEQNQLLLKLSRRADAQAHHLSELLAKKKELDAQIAALNARAKQDRAERNRRQAETRRHEAQSRAATPDEAKQSSNASRKPSGGIPISGRVLRPYGAPIAEGDMRSQGILFSAPLGTPVRAVTSGKVVFADSMKGWGNLVILRHANSYLSLYAHNSELKVHTGMTVQQGTVLGLSGQIEGRETGIYFEVRKGNDTINPRRWRPYRALKR